MTTASGGDLASLSACALAELVRQRRVSPVDIVDDLLAHLDVVEPTLNACQSATSDAKRDEGSLG